MADTRAAAAPPAVKEEGIKRAAPGDDAPKYPPPLKKNVSAFLHFCAEQREAVQGREPRDYGQSRRDHEDLGPAVEGPRGDAKARYNEMAAADKRYDAEKKESAGRRAQAGARRTPSPTRRSSPSRASRRSAGPTPK